MDYPIAATEGSPSSQPHAADEPGRRPKPSKACVPCRARKVKCNAAVVGLPCSCCISRGCPESCVLSTRKRRTRRAHAFPTPEETGGFGANVVAGAGKSARATSRRRSGHADESTEVVCAGSPSRGQENPDKSDCQVPCQSQPDLQCLNILQDAVKDTTDSQQRGVACNTPFSSRPEGSLTPRIQHWNKPLQLDDIDLEYLNQKGVFQLPPPHHLDTLLKTYFCSVYPFAPVIERVEFVRSYRSGNCSLFLLHSILAAAALYAPEDVITGCGFKDHAAAQATFFSKAKILDDFQCESDPISMLQGSLILGVILHDHPSDRDFQYWFHNGTRLAVKLDVHGTCTREDGSCRFLKLCRRIWWVLCFRDIFYSFIDTQNLRLLGNVPLLKPITEDDWESEDLSEASDLLSSISHQQKASLIAHCELAQIFGQCLSIITTEPHKDPRQLMRPLDAWRLSLAEKMHIGDPFHDGDIYYPEALATSYRFEFMMCRILRRHRPHSHVNWSEWAKQRLRSAMFELDTIAKRVLANDTIHKFPMSFMTTIPALLALHIESALDPSETELIHSMARISINQTMLVLDQLKEIPAIKRALPAFEMVLSKKNLHSFPLNNTEQTSLRSLLGPKNLDDMHASTHAQSSMATSQGEQGEHSSFYGDFLGFDFLDRWQIEQLDFSGVY